MVSQKPSLNSIFCQFCGSFEKSPQMYFNFNYLIIFEFSSNLLEIVAKFDFIFNYLIIFLNLAAIFENRRSKMLKIPSLKIYFAAVYKPPHKINFFCNDIIPII